MNRNSGNGAILLIIVAFLIFSAIFVGCQKAVGVGGWGPTTNHSIHVTDKKIDISGSKESTESHYMVYGTENGAVKVFEVGNGLLLGVWNADEIYANINVGGDYAIVTKGKKRANFIWQEYPYITRVTVVDTNAPVKLEL